jgi:thiamine-phosphate pyrophosphorylase
MRENLAAVLRLLLVTDDSLVAGRDIVALCQAAVRGGVTAVQLRLKRSSDRELFALAQRLVTEMNVPEFVNDRLDIAMAAGAAGVHLGADDLAPALARAIVPPNFIIGASVGSDDEVARGAAADYWGIGPLRLTRTKDDAGSALGLARAGRIVERADGRPSVLIGGVQPGDVADARATGFAGVAVVSGILGSDDIEAAARRYASAA